MKTTNNPRQKPSHLSQGLQPKTSKKILPPYAKGIPINQSFIAVCTGSEAWSRAKSESWLYCIKKTLLPIGGDPESYKWNFVCNKEVVIFSHGILETYARLVNLSRALLSYGAVSVLWCIPEFKMMKFVNRRQYAA